MSMENEQVIELEKYGVTCIHRMGTTYFYDCEVRLFSVETDDETILPLLFQAYKAGFNNGVVSGEVQLQQKIKSLFGVKE